MTLPDQTPKLPKLPFLLLDAALLATAWSIHHFAHDPWAGVPLIAIVGCVALAALLCAVPFLADYARHQDEALDDRQRSLEALARTVTGSAEQISIATHGFNEIAELTQKSLRHAEHLPHKLQEKIAEFQAQLANANDAERDELEKEVAELRAADSERLQSVSDKIAKSAAEWARLEAATQKHFAALTAALDEKLALFDTKLAALEAAAKRVPPPPPPAASAAEPAVAVASTVVAPAPASTDSPAETSAADPAPKTEGTAHPPKRPRKPRRETPTSDEPAAPPPSPEPAPSESAPEPAPAPAVEEPPPVPAEKIPEIAPVAPHTKEPFVAEAPAPVSAAPAAESAPAASPANPEPAAAEAPKPARKRAPKKPAPTESEPSLGLVEPPAPEPAAEVTERAVSSDGATRLLVTAYIGIGNRLFIRGDGPGLSWDKGVPLQFVSIGKWRWETNNAGAPVKFKLYKNDDVECTALGPQTLDPGQQQEVTAAF